MSLFTGLF